MKTVAVEIPQELFDRIKRFCFTKGIEENEFYEQAIKDYVQAGEAIKAETEQECDAQFQTIGSKI